MNTATQTRLPRRAVVRTLVAAVVALAAMTPALIAASGVPQTAGVVVWIAAVAAGITRVLAMPAVDALLASHPWLSWLVADPDTGLSTQAARPWHATVRTLVSLLVSGAAVVPLMMATLDVDTTGGVAAAVVAVAAGITRVMALPAFENFLRRFLPWLAAGADDTERISVLARSRSRE